MKDAGDGDEPQASWPMLQILNLQDNQVKELSQISMVSSLRYLDLSSNVITQVSEDFDGHPNLIELDLGLNQLNSLGKMTGMPELKILLLNNNKLKELTGLEGLPNLQLLNLKGNHIAAFDEAFPEFENLREIDLSGNMISKITELEKLANLENLRTLRFKETTFVEQNQQDYMYQVLYKLSKLEQINDFVVNNSLRTQTMAYVRAKNVERKRLEKLEEERLAKQQDDDN